VGQEDLRYGTRVSKKGVRAAAFDTRVKNYVFTRSLPQSPAPPGVEFVNEPIKVFATCLRQKKGKDIWVMGGAGIIASFLDEGEIDEFTIQLIPTTETARPTRRIGVWGPKLEAGGSVNGAPGLSGTEDAGVGGDGVGSTPGAIPRCEVECASRIDSVDGDVLVGEGRLGLTEFWCAGGFHEVDGAIADYRAVALGVDEQRGLFINGDVAGSAGPPVQKNTAHECKVAAHAIAGDEMRIVEESVQDGNIREVSV